MKFANQKTFYIDTVKDVKKIAKILGDVNLPVNEHRSTLLDVCCIMTSNLEPVEWLLEHKANPFVQDEFGLTAFEYAAWNKNKIASSLILILLKQYAERVEIRKE